MNKAKLLAGLLAVGLIVVYFAGCKEDEITTTVTVTAAAITDISTTTATGGGTIDVVGVEAVTERGICWSENHNPTTSGSKAVDASGGTGNFTLTLTGLFNTTTYYVRAYAINDGQTFYSEEVSFETSAPIELIVNGTFALPVTGSQVVSAEPWKTDETKDEIVNNSDPTVNTPDGLLDLIGRDVAEYKGHTGYIWAHDWSKGFYQTVGTVPSVETEYQISYDVTCSWDDWYDYWHTMTVTFSAYTGDDAKTRTVIGTVEIDETADFPGWDQNTWETRTGTFTLTAEQAEAAAGKKLVIEFDVLHYDDGTYYSSAWFNFDNISVKQQ